MARAAPVKVVQRLQSWISTIQRTTMGARDTHWDFDAPSAITKLPFLDEQSKRNILGLTAAKLFGLEVPPAKSGKKAPAAPPVAVPAE